MEPTLTSPDTDADLEAQTAQAPSLLCPGCAYDLSGLEPGRCPECSRVYTSREIRRAGKERMWRWVWLGESVRLSMWLWGAMLVGLGVLRLLEGEGVVGWLVATAIPCLGLGVGVVQLRAVRSRIDHAAGSMPSTPRGLRWSVQAHAACAILLAVPVAGISALMVAGALVGWIVR